MKRVFLLLMIGYVVGLCGFIEETTSQIPTAYILTDEIVEFGNVNYLGLKYGDTFANHMYFMKYGYNDKIEFSVTGQLQDYNMSDLLESGNYIDSDFYESDSIMVNGDNHPFGEYGEIYSYGDIYFTGDSLVTETDTIYSVNAKKHTLESREYNDEDIHLNVKFSFLEETVNSPGFVFGIRSIDNAIRHLFEPEEGYKISPYVVVSKSFLFKEIPTTIHFGNGQGPEFHTFETYESLLFGFFGGLSLNFNNKAILTGEFRGANANICATYKFNKFSIKAGLISIDNVILQNKATNIALFLNFKYTIDHFAKQAKNKNQIIQPNVVPSTDNSDQLLLEELKQIQEERKRSEKELEELRKLLEE